MNECVLYIYSMFFNITFILYASEMYETMAWMLMMAAETTSTTNTMGYNLGSYTVIHT